MKKGIKIFIVLVGLGSFLASCQCKTCKRSNDPSLQICRGDGTEQEYNDAVDAAVFVGYECN